MKNHAIKLLTLIISLFLCTSCTEANSTSVPQSYDIPASQKGTLEALTYQTYESFSYAKGTKTLTKKATVYLPYGYDENTPYDVFYLMHGDWGNETTELGTQSKPSNLKNILDHAIQDGKIKPIIVVCPTFNNNSPQDSSNFSVAMQLTENYHNELINDLMPAVENKYSTYAKELGLSEARTHRAFGGFSMGGIATWRTFQYCLDYFYYFLPMSSDTTLNDEKIFSSAKGRPLDSYFVFLATGTEDYAFEYDDSRAKKMQESEYFTKTNYRYFLRVGYAHDETASNEYIYNGLMQFFPNTPSQ